MPEKHAAATESVLLSALPSSRVERTVQLPPDSAITAAKDGCRSVMSNLLASAANQKVPSKVRTLRGKAARQEHTLLAAPGTLTGPLTAKHAQKSQPLRDSSYQQRALISQQVHSAKPRLLADGKL